MLTCTYLRKPLSSVGGKAPAVTKFFINQRETLKSLPFISTQWLMYLFISTTVGDILMPLPASAHNPTLAWLRCMRVGVKQGNKQLGGKPINSCN